MQYILFSPSFLACTGYLSMYVRAKLAVPINTEPVVVVVIFPDCVA